ncbi:MAG TPA: protease HtpX [Pseudomonadales bacterium]|nr:protease HtpX [Pseudomonadales bacterium]
MLRIALFLATNLAVVLLASVTLNLLGVGSYLNQTGTGLNINSLLIFCAVFGMSGSLVSLFLSKTLAKWSAHVAIIETPQNNTERWLVDTVASLAQEAGIGMPEVGIFPAEQSNAFATGWNKNSALVAVSAGLLQHMREDEVRAVLAHEIAHVSNGDMVTLALIQGVVNTFVMFFARIIGSVVDRALSKDENQSYGMGFYITTFVAEIVLGILASAIVMWFSRYREFRADAGGASLAGRNAMINALRRLQQEQEVPNQLPDSMAAFGINQGLRSGLMALFASHPPLEVRIKALQELS